MDNIRLFLWAGLGVHDLDIVPGVATGLRTAARRDRCHGSSQQHNQHPVYRTRCPYADDLPGLPEASATSSPGPRKLYRWCKGGSQMKISLQEKMIRILTDVLDLEINLVGGDLQKRILTRLPGGQG